MRRLFISLTVAQFTMEPVAKTDENQRLERTGKLIANRF
jgi:hypothetical protein